MATPDKPVFPSGETAAAMKSGGQSQGEDYPNAAAPDTPSDGGGQTRMNYHGPEQLGDDQVGEDKASAPAKGE